VVQDPDNQDVLKAEHLFCERDNRILFEDLNFAAHRGQVIQIKGSNGSGKTTLLRILCGLNEGFRGSLTWFNKPIQDHWEEVHSSLIYMGHRVGVNKILTPVENLRWSVGLSTSVTDEQINEALGDMGLRGFEDSQCFTLSAGQQQRVSIARAIAGSPKLILADEPTGALDSKTGLEIMKILNDLNAKGITIVLVTHEDDIAKYGSRIIKMKDGKILEDKKNVNN